MTVGETGGVQTGRRAVKRAGLALRRALLQAVRPLLRGSRKPTAAPADGGRILFLRGDRIGDMVLSIPALRAIKRQFPRSRLTVLASRANRGVLSAEPAVDAVLVGEDRPGRHPLRLLSRVRALRRERFDLAIDPLIGSDVLSAALALASGAPLRVGFGGAGRELFFNRPVAPPENGRHVVDATLDLLAAVGIGAAERTPRIRPSAGALAWARRWVTVHAEGDLTLIGLHPGAHYPSQRWPAEHYARLIDALRRERLGLPVLIGGPGDAAVIHTIAASARRGFAVHVGDDLERSFALIAQMALLVCNNSGPLHAAAALGVPTVSFIGPTHAGRWWPRGEAQRVLRVEGLGCLGCEAGRCPRGDHACLRRIPPEAALAAVRALLSRTGTSAAAGGAPPAT